MTLAVKANNLNKKKVYFLFYNTVCLYIFIRILIFSIILQLMQ